MEEAIGRIGRVPVEKRTEKDWMELGEACFRVGRRTESLNACNAVLRLNPRNEKARAYVEMINEVLEFFYKDRLNP